jgi:hypothetical protein
MKEEFEGFLHDLDEGAEILEILSDQVEEGGNILLALSALVYQLTNLYKTKEELHRVVLDTQQKKDLIAAYLLIARANKMINRSLAPEKQKAAAELIGDLLTPIWKLIPQGDELLDGLPPIGRSDHPAWSRR